MVTFKSIIVFDSETTSLPMVDHNTTKITELAFLGCEIEHLKDSNELPRVLHKLVLLFNPNKPIHPEASAVSGLSNEILMNVKPFRNEDVEVLRQFIDRLPPPVCIIAHNGDNFDFPILRRALEKVNGKLQNNVYCADSMKAFQSLLLRDNYSKQPMWTRRDQRIASNETTPQHQRTQPVNALSYKHVSRQLFPDEIVLPERILCEESKSKSALSCSHVPKSFKLKDIYYFYFKGYFVNSHRAEEDSKALLGCIMKCEGFFDWLNENSIIFNSVQPLF